MSEPKQGVNRGNAGKGRPKGSANKTTAALKDAILLAAEEVGYDQKGQGGLQGYLKQIAEKDFKAYTTLLGKVLPMQVTGEDGGAIVHRIERLIVDTANPNS